MQREDGVIESRDAGTPQGGVISPILANLFLHYWFDMWMARTWPAVPFERYADDAICHCRTRDEAEALQAALQERFADCRLVLHPQKTKIVYCKDTNRKGTHPAVNSTFSATRFGRDWRRGAAANTASRSCRQPPTRRSRNARGNPALSLQTRTDKALTISHGCSIRSSGAGSTITATSTSRRLRQFAPDDFHLRKWARREYKRFRHKPKPAREGFARIVGTNPALFAHWQLLHATWLDSRSRMNERFTSGCVSSEGWHVQQEKGLPGQKSEPRSLDSRVAGNQNSEAYRQRLPWGGDELPGRNNSERKSGLENE